MISAPNVVNLEGYYITSLALTRGKCRPLIGKMRPAAGEKNRDQRAYKKRQDATKWGVHPSQPRVDRYRIQFINKFVNIPIKDGAPEEA